MRVELRLEGGEHRHRQRIEAVTPVQRDRGDAVANFGKHMGCSSASTGAFIAISRGFGAGRRRGTDVGASALKPPREPV